MSIGKLDISKAKSQLGEKLRVFCRKKYRLKHGAQAKLAKDLEFRQDHVSYWIKTGAIPGWALLVLFRKFPEAKEFFLDGEDGRVAVDQNTPLTPKQWGAMQRFQGIFDSNNKKAISFLQYALDLISTGLVQGRQKRRRS